MALERSFAAVTTLLICVASGASCWAVGDDGNCLTVVERVDTDDFSASVWLGKSGRPSLRRGPAKPQQAQLGGVQGAGEAARPPRGPSAGTRTEGDA